MPIKLIYVTFLYLLLTSSINTCVLLAQKNEDIEDFLNSVIYIRWLSDDYKYVNYGTGFFINKDVEFNDTIVNKKFLITNEHILPKEDDNSDYIEIRIYKGENKTLKFIKIPIKNNKGKYKENIKFGENGEDIAVIDITDIWEKDKIQNHAISYKRITNTDELHKWEFNAGDLFYILGYPNSIYHNKNSDPLLRLGVTSTNPQEPYYFNKKIQNQYGYPEYLDGFLLDASLFHGSSGSMVFYCPMKYPHGKNETKIFNTRIKSNSKSISFREDPFILGIISGSFSDKDFDNQRIDLGIVLSYNVIRNTIDLFRY